MFVLRSKPYGRYETLWEGYYTGKTYQFQHEKYAICDTDIDKAKKYTLLKRAERVAENMLGTIANFTFEVEEIKE